MRPFAGTIKVLIPYIALASVVTGAAPVDGQTIRSGRTGEADASAAKIQNALGTGPSGSTSGAAVNAGAKASPSARLNTLPPGILSNEQKRALLKQQANQAKAKFAALKPQADAEKTILRSEQERYAAAARAHASAIALQQAADAGRVQAYLESQAAANYARMKPAKEQARQAEARAQESVAARDLFLPAQVFCDDKFKAGSTQKVVINTKAGTNCKIQIRYGTGSDEHIDLPDQKADKNGVAEFKFVVPKIKETLHIAVPEVKEFVFRNRDYYLVVSSCQLGRAHSEGLKKVGMIE